MTLPFAAFAVAGLAPPSAIANGQEKTAASAKQLCWSGHIVRIDNEDSFMDVRNPAGVEERIHCDSSTKWTKLNKPVTDHSEFKVEERAIYLGKADEKGAFIVSRIDARVHPWNAATDLSSIRLAWGCRFIAAERRVRSF